MKNTLTKDKKISIAENIISFMLKKGLFQEMAVYVCGYCYTSYPRADYLKVRTPDGVYYRSHHNDVDVAQITSYCNPDLITITFEGTFYNIVNADGTSKESMRLEQEFSDLLEKYGLYYELGHAWNLSVYPIET